MSGKDRVGFLLEDIFDVPRKLFYFVRRRLWFLWKIKYKNFGKHSIISSPIRVMGSKNIEIGENVNINKGAYLFALKITEKIPRLKIGDGSTIGFYSHIVAVDSVIIEKDVLIADKVFIGDNVHRYEDIDIPVINQGVRSTGSVIIGEGSWIGDNVAVLSCHIGKHCVIGTNSVVNKNIPDYCVAVGNPARIIKQYDPKTKNWGKIYEDCFGK